MRKSWKKLMRSQRRWESMSPFRGIKRFRRVILMTRIQRWRILTMTKEGRMMIPPTLIMIPLRIIRVTLFFTMG